MNANKLFTEFSVKKIWDKLLQHDKAMNSTLLILSSGNWVEKEDGTFVNTVSYSTFKDTDKLTVDLFDDGTLSDIVLTEYEQYIDGFEIVNSALVAIANTRPTQTMTVVVKGDFETTADIGNLEDLSEQVSDLSERVDDCFQSVSNGKALIASAITDMEVETDATATFEVMAENIRSIETGVDTSGATATAEHITQGFTAWVNGELIVGTRPQAPNTLSGSGSTWKDWDQLTMSGSVTFSTPFDKVPTVSAYVSYAHDNGYGVTGRFSMSVSNVSRTGFDWRITTSSWEKPAAITFTWTAKTA